MTEWTPDCDAMLRENFEKGLPLSYAEMAGVLNAKFGTDYTRNATIGRGHRLGLKALKKVKRKHAPRPKRATTPAQRPDIAIRKARQQFAPVQRELRCDPLKAGTFHVTELEDGMCKWPSGDGSPQSPFAFCGRGQFEGMPYCGSHCRIAYRIPERRTA